MKKVFLAGMLLGSLIYLVGCDSGDYNSATYGVGIGIGLGPWGDGYYDPVRDGHDGLFGGGFYGPRPYNQFRMGHRPADVRVRPGGGFGRGPGGYGRHRMVEVSSLESSADNAGLNAGLHADLNVSLEVSLEARARDYKITSFANKHQIPVAAAAKIETAFENVNERGLAAFGSVGLNEGAIQNIVNASLPTQDTVNSVATALEISAVQSQSLLQTLVNDFRNQASNGNSTYWKACQATGHWKTPQNANCGDVSWNGCSPDTGATVCY
jgi:hypothetical protein